MLSGCQSIEREVIMGFFDSLVEVFALFFAVIEAILNLFNAVSL